MTSYEKIQLASELDILDVLSAFGVKTKKGRSVCPFCGGKNETKFSVNESKNCFHCFSCGTAGGPLQFVSAQLFDSTDSKYALESAEYLNKIFGLWSSDEELTRLTRKQKEKLKEMDKKRRRREEKEWARKKILAKYNSLCKKHNQLQFFFVSSIYDPTVSAEVIKNKILEDCMILQDMDYLEEKIEEYKLWKAG